MIHLVAIGNGVSGGMLDTLAAGLARELSEACHVRQERVDPEFAFDPVRNQYHATSILRRLASMAGEGRLLGVASVDLYVPIFTFVFGEAQLGGPCAVVSQFRLNQGLYGLPEDAELSGERLLKEALHELGHTYGMRHCHDWSCAMSATTAIERLDMKNAAYCSRCWRGIDELQS